MRKNYDNNSQKITSRKEQELTALGFTLQKIIDEADDNQKSNLEHEIGVLKEFYSYKGWNIVKRARRRYGTLKPEKIYD